MRTVIVGAGPTGLYTAIALARRGHDVVVIDRDPGPDGGRWWDGKGVMQFHHPHGFRQQVVDALQAEMPEVWHGLLAAGAQPATLPGQPGVPAGLHCRRLTFERILRSAAEAQPGVTLRTGHVDEVSGQRGRATGVRVDRRQVGADLVIDASGRAGRLTRALRAPADGGDCGISYVSRQYQLRPGAPYGPINAPFGVILAYPGYLVAAFIHDNRIISALIARASADRGLAALRTPAAFEAATRAIPALAEWTDPARSRPITPVLPGGRLYNSYQGQLNDAGRVALDGLIYVGDTVCTTNPAARAREIYAGGWRPPVPPGPSGEELAGLVAAAADADSHDAAVTAGRRVPRRGTRTPAAGRAGARPSPARRAALRTGPRTARVS